MRKDVLVGTGLTWPDLLTEATPLDHTDVVAVATFVKQVLQGGPATRETPCGSPGLASDYTGIAQSFPRRFVVSAQ